MTIVRGSDIAEAWPRTFGSSISPRTSPIKSPTSKGPIATDVAWFDGLLSFRCWTGTRLNIWSFDTKTTERKQITQFQNDDCKFPGIGPGPMGTGEIVVQNGTSLYLVDLATSQSKAVAITVPGDRPKLRPEMLMPRTYQRHSSISQCKTDHCRSPRRHLDRACQARISSQSNPNQWRSGTRPKLESRWSVHCLSLRQDRRI